MMTLLLQIYNLLRIDQEGYRVRVHFSLLQEKGADISELNKVCKKLFGYELRKASNNLYYFKSKRVYEYLQSLFIYEPAWKSISNTEEVKLLRNWNDVWKK